MVEAEGARMRRRYRRLRNRPAKGGPYRGEGDFPTEFPKIPEGASPFPGNNLCQQAFRDK